MEHLTTRPTLDLASHLFKFYSKDNNGNSNNNIDIKDINDNKDNKDNKLNILLPAPPWTWLHISLSFTTRTTRATRTTRIINGTSYYPPHPGPGFTSLQVLQQEERTIKRTTVARAGMMIIPLGLALLYA